jgi:predicted Zn-dependent peptidase
MEKVMRGSMWTTVGAALLIASATAMAQTSATDLPRPTPPAARPFQIPPFAVDTLPNGLRVAVLENHEVPIVIVRIPVPATGPYGVSFVDPAGKEGAFGMLNASLREGTETRTASQIADAVENLGLHASDPVAPLFGAFGFNGPRSTWQSALELYGDMLMHPTIPSDAFKRLQDTYVGLYGRPSGTRQAQMAATRALFGASSPFARFPTAETIKAITRDDLVALQQRYLRPENFMIAIAGDVTREEARAAAARIFGSWQRGGDQIAAPTIPMPTQMPATTIYLVDAPGSNQAVVTSIQPIPGRDTPNAPAIQLVMNSLGEGNSLVGRVPQAFRADHGLSYSPQLSTVWRAAGEPSFITTTIPVAAEKADTAVTELLRVLREMKSTKPITDAEFAAARSYAVGRIPRDMERIDNAMQVGMMVILRDRLPPAFYNDWLERMSALSLADVRAAASQYIDPDHTAVAVIGDRSRIEAALRATGIPVVIVDR